METTQELQKRRVPLFLKIFGMVIVGVTFATLFAFIFGWLVMLLWNNLLPSLFGLPTVSYWQAVGLTILAKLFFGGFGAHHPSSPPNRLKKHISQWCSDDRWCPGGTWNNWKHYDKYWNEEGKKAFEEYLEKKRLTT